MKKTSAHRIHGTRVLLVTDDATLSQRLETLLIEHQYAVDVEHNTEAAITRLTERRYELLWLDMSEALRSDFGLLKHINDNALSTVSLIVDRGSSDELATNTALGLGAQDMLSVDDSDLEFYQASQNAMQVMRARLRNERDTDATHDLTDYFVDNAGHMIWTLDAAGAFTYVNAHFAEVLGHEPAQLIGKPLQEIVNPRQYGEIRTAFQLLAAGRGPHKVNLQLLPAQYNARSESRTYEVSLRSLDSVPPALAAIPGEHRYFVIAHDATSKQRAHQERVEKAFQDPLTGLPNRSLFINRLQQSLAIAEKESLAVAVLLIDLKGFKAINDEYSHDTGDQILAATAKRLSNTLRASDTIARFGGDEFTVILNDIEEESRALLVAEKVAAALSRAFHIDDKSIRTGCNIGIALYPQVAIDARSLIEQSDEAMYQARRNPTRNIAVYSHQDASADQSLPGHRELYTFIESGAFSVRYTPAMGVRQRMLHSIEARTHFHHPTLSALSATQFARLIENHKLGLAWFLASLDKACADLTLLAPTLRTGGLRMGIEAPASMLQSADFAERVLALLAQHGIGGEVLELIIPEVALEGERRTIKSQLRSLCEAGVLLSIRDFGSANASLHNLAHHPISAVRLAQGLTASSERNAPAKTVARTIAAVARELNMKLIAEGVETLQQLQFVAELDCSAAQGIVLSSDLDCDQLIARLQSQVKSSFRPLRPVAGKQAG